MQLAFYQGRQTMTIIKNAVLKVINAVCRSEVLGVGNPRRRQALPLHRGVRAPLRSRRGWCGG